MSPSPGGPGFIWRIQASPRDLSRGLVQCDLPPNCLVIPDATWLGMVPDGAYVECPTFFLEDKVGFVALLAFLAVNSLRFRLYARAVQGEADGLLMAYPRLDEAMMDMLRHFDPRSAQQINLLWRRLEEFLGQISLPGAVPSAALPSDGV